MVGCTSETDVTKLAVSGGGRVEVLGGNHTRIDPYKNLPQILH